MVSKQRTFSVVPGLLAVALVATACQDSTQPNPAAAKPNFWAGEEQCPPAKMTGGGRIDFPPGEAQKNPPASHMYQTFGAHVISDGPDLFGNCQIKGSLEWVDHRNDFRVNGRPLNLHSIEITFVERIDDSRCSDGALHWGGRLVLKNTGDESFFEVVDCDDGEPGVGRDGFAISAPDIGYRVVCDAGSKSPYCILTGGNRQFHPTH